MAERVGVYDPSEDVPIPGGGDVRDPYPDFARARETCPVMKVARGGAPGGGAIWMAYDHDDVTHVLRDDVTFSSRVLAATQAEVMGRTILEMDGPEHMRQRSLVAQAFRPAVLARWEKELVEPLVQTLIDGFVADGRADLVQQLTYHYPIRVIARILGLPDDDHRQFQRWAIALIANAADRDRGRAASEALRAYLAPFLAARRVDPQDDLISELVKAEVDGQVLSDDEIMPFLLLILPAGGETTYRATGNLLYGLLTHPDQLEAVRKDRSLVRQAVEEALRWEPPLLILAREADAEVELGGETVQPGDMVTICMGSANRAGAPGERPDDFDIFRPQEQHLSFGTGPHMCLGMHLARLEMRVAINVVLDRLPGLRLDPEAEDVHVHGMVFRSPTALPVLWDT